MSQLAGVRLLVVACVGAMHAPGALAQASTSVAQSVRGVVFDSTAMRPLSGAQVQLVALPVQAGPRLVGTDSTGAFEFDSLGLGTYLLAFSHPRLDSMGVEPSMVRLEVRAPGTLVAPLATPSVETIVRRTCRAEVSRDSTGILRGFARSARDGFPIPRARLRVEWPEFVLRRGKLEPVTRSIDAEANDEGRYLVCGVPLGTTVLVLGHSGADSSGVLELEMPGQGLLRRDLLLGSASHAVDAFGERGAKAAVAAEPDSLVRAAAGGRSGAGASRDSAPAIASEGDGGRPTASGDAGGRPRLRGRVSDPNGEGIPGAQLRLLGSEREARSDEAGDFVLADARTGTQMLEVRALGFRVHTVAVDVMGSGDVSADVTLQPIASSGAIGLTRLDTLRVQGQNRLDAIALSTRRQFARRVQSGVGQFITDSLIRAKAPHLPSELFRGMPGLTVTNGSGGQGVYMRASATFNATKGLCLPTVFIDGARAPRAVVDQVAVVSDMRAVEVYARSEVAPTQYQTSDGCGAIVIWTRTMWDASRHPPRE